MLDSNTDDLCGVHIHPHFTPLPKLTQCAIREHVSAGAPGQVAAAEACCVQVSAPWADPEAELASVVGGQDHLRRQRQQ
jgi:hypothetical protein